MQQTYQTRLLPSACAEGDLAWMGAYAEAFCHAERRLYAAVAAGVDPKVEKPKLMNELGLSARQYNALQRQLQGKIDGTTTLLKDHVKDLQRQLKQTEKSLEKVTEKLFEVENDLLRMPLRKLAALKQQAFNKQRRIATLKRKLKKTRARISAPVPGICFGSRKLFSKQFNLEVAGYATHEEWLADWRAARSAQFFLIGSKDETGGNQSCKATLQDDGRLSLLVKLPPLLTAQGAPAFIRVNDVGFSYGHENIVAVLMSGDALTYRFLRDDKGWRVFVSTEVDATPIKTLPRKYVGCLGVDFNANHLAWSRVDRSGNIVETGRIGLPMMHKTSEQREAPLSEALGKLFAVAAKHNLAVVREDLDFTEKKKSLKAVGAARYARMLTGLAVAQYRNLCQAKAERAGVELITVNPAYTSVAGRLKYAVRLGVTVHQAAAGVIARRGMDFKDRQEALPRAGTHRVPLQGGVVVLELPARNRSGSTRTTWASVSRVSARQCADASRARSPSSKLRRGAKRHDSAAVNKRRCGVECATT